MRVAIQTNGFAVTTSLRLFTEDRIATALGWARQHVRKLAVTLSDINGPRGGLDKKCKIKIRLGGRREIVVQDLDSDLYAAITRAVSRADRIVVREVERMRTFKSKKSAEPQQISEVE